MKIRIIYIFCTFLFLSFSETYCQENILNQKLSFEFDSLTYNDALKLINNKANVDFTYNSSIIPENEKISATYKNKTIDFILNDIFKKTQIEYQIVENQIILKENPNKEIFIEKYTLTGYLKDEINGETLIGATIYIPEIEQGTISNSYGFYSITIPEGKYDVVFSYLGFNNDTVEIDLSNNSKYNIELSSKNELMQEVIVRSNDDPLAEVIQKGESSLKPGTINSIPALLGEADVIKSLQAVPGIKSFGDGSTSFFVRGGNRDQNLILIDEAPIYNPTHLMGFYSTFIPEAIKDVKIYKGNIPANYGGRLSSLIDIRTKDGNMKQWNYGLSLGLIASKITIDGPLIKDKSSVFVSRRKSHFRQLLGNNIDENSDIYFNDFNAKLNYIVNENNRLFFSLYFGKDAFIVSKDVDQTGIEWQNTAATFRWNHVFTDKLFSNTTFHTSNYRYRLYMSYNNQEYWNSEITNFNFKTDFSYFHNPQNITRFGINIGFHGFDPGNFHVADTNAQNSIPHVYSSNTAERAIYMNNNHILKDKLSITYGFRFVLWSNFGEAYVLDLDENYEPIDTLYYAQGEEFNAFANIEPRLGLKYKFINEHILKANYTHTTQHIHLISNSISPFTSFDVWLPSGPNIKPQKAHQYTFGYEKKIMNKKSLFSLDFFYKSMKNQIDYIDHAYMILNPLLETQLRFGEAWSYGIEALIKKNTGNLTGWITYSYSRTFNKIKDINNNRSFPAYFDRPHDFNIFLSYQFSKRFNFSANWIFTSGSAFTSPTSFYEYNGYTIPVYNERNNDRLPNYHRLDIALNYRLNKKEQRFNHRINFSIFNLYNHKNPIAINYNKHLDETGFIVISGNQYNTELVSTQSYLYTFLPSISYNLNF